MLTRDDAHRLAEIAREDIQPGVTFDQLLIEAYAQIEAAAKDGALEIHFTVKRWALDSLVKHLEGYGYKVIKVPIDPKVFDRPIRVYW